MYLDHSMWLDTILRCSIDLRARTVSVRPPPRSRETARRAKLNGRNDSWMSRADWLPWLPGGLAAYPYVLYPATAHAAYRIRIS